MENALVRALGGGFCLLVAGCGGAGSVIDEGGEAARAREDALYVYADKTLFTANNFQLTTCFEGGWDFPRQEVRAAVEDTWDEHTKLSIDGWAQCPSTIPANMVPINLVPGATGSCGGGIAAPGVGGRLFESPRYQVKINYCPDFVSLRATAVHELGHVIGFVHEHVRPDRGSATDFCRSQFDGQSVAHDMLLPVAGHWYGTVYDPRSIMNYCRDWDNNGTPDILQAGDDPWQLSLQDFMGAQSIYGWYDSGFDLPEGAFAWAQQPTTTGPYPADIGHSWSSAGFLQTQITRESLGTYRVDFARQGASAGNFQVSAFGSANRCKIHNWSTSGFTQQLRVKCRTPSGSAADTQFVAKYQRREDEPGWESAYVYANQPTASSYIPTGGYNWNSLGLANTIQRTGSGVYLVTLVGQGGDFASRGVVDVTAVGTGNEYCVVGGYDDDGEGSEEVTVRCYTSAGSATDTAFMLSFGHRSMAATLSYAHVAANNPTSPSYTPNRQLAHNACGTGAGPATITRTGTGRYDIHFDGMVTSNGMLGRSTVKVTAWSSSGNYCNPWSWTAGNGTVGSDTLVSVRCFTPSGSAVDSSFFATLGTSYTGDCL